MYQLFIRDLHGRLSSHEVSGEEMCGEKVFQIVQKECAIPLEFQRLVAGGREISASSKVHSGEEIMVLLRVEGGKGGFGSMLRAMGKNLHRTTNFGSLRDLSGRRIRHVEAEKQLGTWLKEKKKPSHEEVKEMQAEYRSINETGRLLEKRVCPFGDDCRYMWKCKYRHPCEIETEQKAAQKKLVEDKKNRPLAMSFGSDPNDPFAGMYDHIADLGGAVMEGLNRGKKLKIQAQEEKLRKEKENNLEIRRHSMHPHPLKFGVRPFDWIMCDLCSNFFVGSSWHCVEGSDFDLCTDCVRKDDKAKKKKPRCIEFIKPVRQGKKRKKNQGGAPANKKRRKKDERGSLKSLGYSFEQGFEEIPLRIELLFPEMNKINQLAKEAEKKKEESAESSPKLDLEKHDAESLKALGMDAVKAELQHYGLKCGGNLQQRVDRLMLVQTLGLANIPTKHFPKKKPRFL